VGPTCYEPSPSPRWRSAIGWPAKLCLAVVLVGTNVLGTALVTVLAVWVLPTGPLPVDASGLKLLNVLLVVLYLVVTTPLALVWGGMSFRLRSDDPDHERRLVLLGPLRLVIVQLVFWFGATLLFGCLNATYSWRLGLAVAETVMIGGITSCAVSFLGAERILRPAAARVLAGEVPRKRPVGVLVRWVLFWVLGTAVPVTGLVSYGIGALVLQDVSARQLALVMLVGGVGALVTGLTTTIGAARAAADPITSVRQAMGRVEQGELEVSVPVYDGTEIGQLQAGFNKMAAGLRERERIRDLFARQVGQDVAQVTAAADEVQLGGEVRLVGVLFVDLVGSTALAVARPPTEVVALLNRFFAVVFQVVDESGGWINKFEGDAALAVFGAPTPHDDPAGEALAAGRRLAVRLAEELPDVSVGIGVSAGEAVAGYVGDVRRFEYTVIGDPVNEAARLVELAKDVRGGLLASGVALELAGPGERANWRSGDAVILRGRSDATTLATPMLEVPDTGEQLEAPSVHEALEAPSAREPLATPPAHEPSGRSHDQARRESVGP
jgi:adenylate cyclase